MEQRYKEQILDSFCAHELLAAYIRSQIVCDDRAEKMDVGSAVKYLLYTADEQIESIIKAYISDLTDDEYEHALEQ
ncbi:MAG TPA: hypothetical protein DEP23_06790 [Ruminococcaceae bacterium]|nr:hypothetical protein [Oscillospiraceae bacterium]